MSSTLNEALLLLLVGMGAVFSVLVLLAGLLFALSALDEFLNRRRIKEYAVKVEKGEEDEVNDELIAVIGAAVTTTLQKRVKVRRVQFLGSAGGSSWSHAGRSSVMSSHAVEKKK